MNAMKKTVLATAILMSMGATASQAATQNYSFSGSFTMYQPFVAPLMAETAYDSSCLCLLPTGNMIANPAATATTGPVVEGGGPVTGWMSFNTNTGSAVASLTPSTLFGGFFWTATGVSMQVMSNPGDPMWGTANMLFNWNGNLNIPVTMGWAMSNTGYMTTLDLDGDGILGSPMVSGPFAGFNATFEGQAMPSAVPVPAAAWLLGSGLLGLVGVSRRKSKLA